jgi:hypothetical protein
MTNPTNPRQNKKSTKPYLALIFAPLPLLMLVAIVQVVAQMLSPQSSGDTNTGMMVVNALSAIIGVVAVIMTIFLPLWIVMYIRVLDENRGNHGAKSKTVAIVLAVLFASFAWLYTYKIDKRKFWINLLLYVATLGLWGIAAWIWAIIDTAGKDEAFYIHYPNYVKPPKIS